MAPLLLVVDDDEATGTTLARALQANGYGVQWCRYRDAADLGINVNLVLLNLGPRGLDGLQVCRRIRRASASTPVIMLGERRSEVDVVTGLDAGAVDYLREPFEIDELLARVRVQLRAAHDRRSTVVEIADVRVDIGARRVWVTGDEIDLRRKEFAVLVMLMNEAGRVVTRERLLGEVWGEAWSGSTKTLDVTMASLRRRLREPSAATSRISGLRGIGYRFERPTDNTSTNSSPTQTRDTRAHENHNQCGETRPHDTDVEQGPRGDPLLLGHQDLGDDRR